MALPERTEKVKKRTKVLLAIVILLLAMLTFWLWPRPITVTNYEISADVSEKTRIVQLTDLHGRQFGKDNGKLLEKVREQKPELIFITGDMLNSDEEDIGGLCKLVEELSGIAPVYYSYGNHETAWMSMFGKDLRGTLTDAGAVVLSMEYVAASVNGQTLIIGGYDGYYRTPHMELDDPEKEAEKLAFADEFEALDGTKLLLCHVPTNWLDWGQINENSAGIVFCGHYHGGQIRLPVIDKGLYAPYVKWFPDYTKGVFYGDCATCVLSAGLGTTSGIPRIYNPPEIVVADIIPQK